MLSCVLEEISHSLRLFCDSPRYQLFRLMALMRRVCKAKESETAFAGKQIFSHSLDINASGLGKFSQSPPEGDVDIGVSAQAAVGHRKPGMCSSATEAKIAGTPERM